ncbi:hypothetical protein HanXRQr2_Chr10g0456881 [Helianthus annuus]|uniref:Uncharacterized protein n=1 Tax=Helianthus annuus TaxID=4232 RepID=A0A9K3I0Q2_HELAN|nr:hypothetical protein HanXRQr2_Chr10g0456881 [Helianthus annuus]KAJ0885081.1 hypothetical protein HanPSC8_Chr10g0441271 [Helianthus annuus]
MVIISTKAEVSGGSIFKVLAGRKVLKCPCEEDLVNSASATTDRKAQVKGKRPCVENLSSASLVEIPNSTSATTGKRPTHPALDPAEIEGVTYELVTEESFYKPLTPLVFSSANVDDASDIYYVYRLEDGYRMVTEIKYRQPHMPKKSVPPTRSCIRLQN